MVTPEQRKFMYEQVRAFRSTKPIFTMDFWNDGEYAGGCVAGGRRYLHINAGGDIEPCAFIHYSDSNIREKTILEALQSPLFKAYRAGQPFNENHLRPARFWITRKRLGIWCMPPAHIPPIWKARKMSNPSPASAKMPPGTGRRWRTNCGPVPAIAPAAKSVP